MCNNVQFSKSGSDSRYFYNEDSASIFNHKNDNQNKILSLLRIGDVLKRDIASSSLNTLIKDNIVEEYTKEVYNKLK